MSIFLPDATLFKRKEPAMREGSLRLAVVWAFFEGLARTGSLSTVKWLGIAFTTLGEIFASNIILGAIQAIGAAVAMRVVRTPVWLGARFFGWCALFAVFAAVQNVIPFVAFGQGADLPVYIFIVVGLSIVPIALLDTIFFRVRLATLGWMGVVMGIVGGWAMLGFPTPAELMKLPGWVWLALISMISFAINQALVKAAGRVRTDLPKHAKALGQGLWVGVLVVGICAAGLMIFPAGAWSVFSSAKFMGGSALIGLFVLGLLTGNSMALQLGLNMPVKHVIATAVFLLGSAVAGVALFGEQFETNKLIGILCYFLAYFLIRSGSMERN